MINSSLPGQWNLIFFASEYYNETNGSTRRRCERQDGESVIVCTCHCLGHSTPLNQMLSSTNLAIFFLIGIASTFISEDKVVWEHPIQRLCGLQPSVHK